MAIPLAAIPDLPVPQLGQSSMLAAATATPPTLIPGPVALLLLLLSLIKLSEVVVALEVVAIVGMTEGTILRKSRRK